jgi:capsular polysaccharide biosynthesis protein
VLSPAYDTRGLRRQLLVVPVVVFLAAIAAFGITSVAQKVYTAEAMLVVSAGLGTDTAGNADVLTAPRIAQTYASLATTRSVLSKVITAASLTTDPAELNRLLRVSADPASPFIAISVTDPDPARAEVTANALADILVTEATIPASSSGPEQPILEVVERAIVPDAPSGPRVLFNTLLAAATALVLAVVGIATAAYYRGLRVVKPARTG